MGTQDFSYGYHRRSTHVSFRFLRECFHKRIFPVRQLTFWALIISRLWWNIFINYMFHCLLHIVHIIREKSVRYSGIDALKESILNIIVFIDIKHVRFSTSKLQNLFGNVLQVQYYRSNSWRSYSIGLHWRCVTYEVRVAGLTKSSATNSRNYQNNFYKYLN